MTDIEKIGSKNSDADLVIENLTTKKSDGSYGNTSDITITMSHTENTNSIDQAADLTVYFDEDYLLSAGETSAGATLTINLINAVTNVEGENPIEGFTEITFKVGETEVAVDITSVATNAELSGLAAYAEVAKLINAKLEEMGIDGVSAKTLPAKDAFFSIDLEQAGHNAGDSAGVYYPIILENTGSGDLLTGVDIDTSGLAYDTDLNNSFQTKAPTAEEIPVSVNVELEKVGREGEGGDLKIGGKETTAEGEGIHTFNMTVLGYTSEGNNSKDSYLGSVTSTNNWLKEVNIASEARADESYASLTIADAFTEGAYKEDLDRLDADAFLGDLTIGNRTAAWNINTFTAMGGGDITLNQLIDFDGDATSVDGFASEDNNVYTVDTGAGNDTITVDANSGAQLAVSTGAGDDVIEVSIDGQDDSGSDLTYAAITSTSGNNTVIVTSDDSAHHAEITLGGGSDTVTGNSVNVDVATGAGNDTIYVNNTGEKAVITYTVAEVLAETSYTTALTAANFGGTADANGETVSQVELLAGRMVTVTLATVPGTSGVDADAQVIGFESLAVKIEPTNGALTTVKDLNDAIAKAINTDPVLSKLALAEVDSLGNLNVNYLVDGIFDAAAPDVALEYTITSPTPALTATSPEIVGITQQLEELFQDSTITEAGVLEDYNTPITQGIEAATGDVLGAASTDTDSNIVNGGLGNDVIVLSSSANSATTFDTIEIDADGFGNDTIVHFTTGAGGDVIDFAHLNNVTAASSSTASQRDIDGTVVTTLGALTANAVAQVDMAAIGGATAITAVTEATVKAALAGINPSEPGGFVGTLTNSVIMVQDTNNDGYYKVFEVVHNGTEFTEVVEVGSLDFGATTTLDSANIA